MFNNNNYTTGIIIIEQEYSCYHKNSAFLFGRVEWKKVSL